MGSFLHELHRGIGGFDIGSIQKIVNACIMKVC